MSPTSRDRPVQGVSFQANAVLALGSEARIAVKGRTILAWYGRQISPLPGAGLPGLFFCTYEFEAVAVSVT